MVKEVDSKSTGLCPREFKSRRRRFCFFCTLSPPQASSYHTIANNSPSLRGRDRSHSTFNDNSSHSESPHRTHRNHELSLSPSGPHCSNSPDPKGHRRSPHRRSLSLSHGHSPPEQQDSSSEDEVDYWTTTPMTTTSKTIASETYSTETAPIGTIRPTYRTPAGSIKCCHRCLFIDIDLIYVNIRRISHMRGRGRACRTRRAKTKA